MKATPKKPEPSLWTREQTDNLKLKRELDSCEKENKSLNDLVRHIGETVIGHIKGKG
jgi:hypothetical protein